MLMIKTDLRAARDIGDRTPENVCITGYDSTAGWTYQFQKHFVMHTTT